MKNSLAISAMAAVAISAMVSCQTPEKLSAKMEGTWTDTPQRIEDRSVEDLTIQKMYTFEPTEDAKGNVTISSMLDVTKAFPQEDELNEPLTLSVAATATMTGTYEAKAFDKFEIKLAPSSLEISIDPEAVKYIYNDMENLRGAVAEEIKASQIEQLTARLKPVLKENFTSGSEFTSVKITDSLMQCQSGDRDLTLRRQ